MSQVITLDDNCEAVRYLSSKDKRLSKVISMLGPITYAPYEDAFAFLVNQILGQLLAAKVSKKMSERLELLCGGTISPENVLKLSVSDIRSTGASTKKSEYILGLASAFANGEIDTALLNELPDKEIIRELTKIKGIGSWTAKMYLIFVLDRKDVLPFEDYAFLQGYGWLYKTEEFSRKSVEKKTMKWSPYRSIAARYLYKALDGGLIKREFHMHKD